MGEEEERNKTDHQRQEAAVPTGFVAVGPWQHRLQSAVAAVDLQGNSEGINRSAGGVPAAAVNLQGEAVA